MAGQIHDMPSITDCSTVIVSDSDPSALKEDVLAWYIFPLLLMVHYSAFAVLFGTGLAPAFFLGRVLALSNLRGEALVHPRS